MAFKRLRTVDYESDEERQKEKWREEKELKRQEQSQGTYRRLQRKSALVIHNKENWMKLNSNKIDIIVICQPLPATLKFIEDQITGPNSIMYELGFYSKKLCFTVMLSKVSDKSECAYYYMTALILGESIKQCFQNLTLFSHVMKHKITGVTSDSKESESHFLCGSINIYNMITSHQSDKPQWESALNESRQDGVLAPSPGVGVATYFIDNRATLEQYRIDKTIRDVLLNDFDC